MHISTGVLPVRSCPCAPPHPGPTVLGGDPGSPSGPPIACSPDLHLGGSLHALAPRRHAPRDRGTRGPPGSPDRPPLPPPYVPSRVRLLLGPDRVVVARQHDEQRHPPDHLHCGAGAMRRPVLPRHPPHRVPRRQRSDKPSLDNRTARAVTPRVVIRAQPVYRSATSSPSPLHTNAASKVNTRVKLIQGMTTAPSAGRPASASALPSAPSPVHQPSALVTASFSTRLPTANRQSVARAWRPVRSFAPCRQAHPCVSTRIATSVANASNDPAESDASIQPTPAPTATNARCARGGCRTAVRHVRRASRCRSPLTSRPPSCAAVAAPGRREYARMRGSGDSGPAAAPRLGFRARATLVWMRPGRRLRPRPKATCEARRQDRGSEAWRAAGPSLVGFVRIQLYCARLPVVERSPEINDLKGVLPTVARTPQARQMAREIRQLETRAVATRLRLA